MVGFFWCLRLREMREVVVAFVSKLVFKVSTHTELEFLDDFLNA